MGLCQKSQQAKRLQFELHQERPIHAMLEKTIGRASTASSPGHANFSAQVIIYQICM